MNLPLHIGLDDTDSIEGGCTTYIAALLVEKFKSRVFLDYPGLIRLNPNVPWKTRGNAALSLRISIDEELIEDTIGEVIDVVEDMSELDCSRTDPGIVFHVGTIPDEFKAFSHKTIQDVVSQKEALDLIRHFGAEAVGFKNGRGIIGALAAIGEVLDQDNTFELIAYRDVDNRGKPRIVNNLSIFNMDKQMSGLTFNNVDNEKRRVLLTPRGPDPVLLGIRGESPSAVKKAYRLIDIGEDVERWVIFRTNQGTDAHLQRVERIFSAKPYQSIVVSGSVVIKPHYVPGRHLIFTLADESGQIDCAAYEPTGKFRKIVGELLEGDQIEAYGGVRPESKRNPKTINLEKIKIKSLTPKVVLSNPVCCSCNKHMESMGRAKGFRCKLCKLRLDDAEKIPIEIERNLNEGIYIPPPRANRHLTKPMSRYGLEKTGADRLPVDFWGLGRDVEKID